MVTRILLPIIVFAALAFAFSWVINHYLPPFTWLTIDVNEVLTGCGPALSGLLCYQLFGTPNTFKLSLAGSKPTVVFGVTFLSLFIPVLLSKQPNPFTAISLVLTQFMYTLGEEFGWRHYLQNAVATFTKWQQALIIGTIWFFWHYAILTDPTTMLNGQPLPFYVGVPLLVGLLALFSKLAGDVVIRTQAVLLSTVLHYIGKVSNNYSMLAIYILVLTIYLMWPKIKRLSIR